MPEQPAKQTNWALVVLVAIGIYFVAERWKKSDPAPKPTPTVNVQSVVNKSLDQQRASFAQAFSDVAADVTEGSVTTGEQLFNALAPRLKSAREKAFSDIDGVLQEQLPEQREIISAKELPIS